MERNALALRRRARNFVRMSRNRLQRLTTIQVLAASLSIGGGRKDHE
jgi:hypothetical protein